MSDLITVSELVNIRQNSSNFSYAFCFCLSLNVKDDHEYFGLGVQMGVDGRCLERLIQSRMALTGWWYADGSLCLGP